MGEGVWCGWTWPTGALYPLPLSPTKAREGVLSYNVGMLKRQSNVRRTLKDRRRELRDSATEAETILWPYLRSLREQGYIFRRQHSVGPYITDFCCPAEKLIVEIDGKIHNLEFQQKYDKERTSYLNSASYRVIRFKNEEILTDPQRVIETILQDLFQNPSPAPVGEG